MDDGDLLFIYPAFFFLFLPQSDAERGKKKTPLTTRQQVGKLVAEEEEDGR